MKIKFRHEIGFIAPSPNNSFWIITSYGQELYEVDIFGNLIKKFEAAAEMYLSFAVKHPRFFVPISIKEKNKESKIYSFDSRVFDPYSEDLYDTMDYSSGDELWGCPSPDEDHYEDAEWAIAWKMNRDNSPCFDTSSVLRAACSYPFLAWRRNLIISDIIIDPFSAVAPPGVINALSRSKGLVFANISTDRSVSFEGVGMCQQICLSSRCDYVLTGYKNTLHLLKNPLFE